MDRDSIFSGSTSIYSGGDSDIGSVSAVEKVHRKLSKVQQRRDHYAKLYYRTLAELEQTKLELARAKQTIRALRDCTSPDSGTSLSPDHWRPVPAFTRSLSLNHAPMHRGTSVPRRLPSHGHSAFQPPTVPPPRNPPLFNHTSFSQPTGLYNGNATPLYHTQPPPPLPVRKAHNGRVCKKQLGGVEMLDLLSRISSPKCTIQSLEVRESQLGEPGAMSVFCADLVKNKSITSLSLPGNEINGQSLGILLEAIQRCSQMKELLLRDNNIGVDCVETIKQFLSHTTLDSLVLTGNEIEQHSHLLSGELPGEFSMEYSEWDTPRKEPQDLTNKHSMNI